MREMQPIRKREDIERMKNELLKKGSRDYMLFVLGINTGLRVGDLLKLKVKDVTDTTHISLEEEKTDKAKRFMINPQLKQDIDNYTEEMEQDEYLFQSQKGTNKPITRVQAYRVIKTASVKLGLVDIGTHTLRKTFGYWHYQQYKDIALLQNLFNHSSPSITLRYIGINQDIMDETIKGFYL